MGLKIKKAKTELVLYIDSWTKIKLYDLKYNKI